MFKKISASLTRYKLVQKLNEYKEALNDYEEGHYVYVRVYNVDNLLYAQNNLIEALEDSDFSQRTPTPIEEEAILLVASFEEDDA